MPSAECHQEIGTEKFGKDDAAVAAADDDDYDDDDFPFRSRSLSGFGTPSQPLLPAAAMLMRWPRSPRSPQTKGAARR